MAYKEIMGIAGAIAFCLYVIIEYYRGKKVEKISENLTEKKVKELRKELMTRKDMSWMATIKLPKIFEYIGNVLAVLVIFFLLVLFVSSLYQILN